MKPTAIGVTVGYLSIGGFVVKSSIDSNALGDK